MKHERQTMQVGSGVSLLHLFLQEKNNCVLLSNILWQQGPEQTTVDPSLLVIKYVLSSSFSLVFLTSLLAAIFFVSSLHCSCVKLLRCLYCIWCALLPWRTPMQPGRWTLRHTAGSGSGAWLWKSVEALMLQQNKTKNHVYEKQYRNSTGFEHDIWLGLKIVLKWKRKWIIAHNEKYPLPLPKRLQVLVDIRIGNEMIGQYLRKVHIGHLQPRPIITW